MDNCITSAELAVRVRVSEQTIRLWRMRGTGPKYLKLGRKILYRESDILAWEEVSTRRSTKQ